MQLAAFKGRKFKRFGAEYLMIMLSILTALALEDVAQDIQHRTLATEAAAKIDAEINVNLDELSTIITHNDAQAAKLDVIRKALLADIRSGASDAHLMKKIMAEYEDAFELSIKSPSLRREAWEVAVANQAVSWMQAKELKRYSAVYAEMRDVQAIAISGTNVFFDGPRMLDVGSNVQMGVSNPREVYRMINQSIVSYASLNGNLKGLRKELQKSQRKPGQ
jgi:hypothetical protein